MQPVTCTGCNAHEPLYRIQCWGDVCLTCAIVIEEDEQEYSAEQEAKKLKSQEQSEAVGPVDGLTGGEVPHVTTETVN